jgi:hypothetical protein
MTTVLNGSIERNARWLATVPARSYAGTGRCDPELCRVRYRMSLIESSPHLKRKTGRPRGRPPGSGHPGLAQRLKQCTVQNDFAALLDKWGPN